MPILASSGELIRSRRQFLRKSAFGFGSLALAHLLDRDGRAFAAETASSIQNPLRAKEPHSPAKAKSVIFIFLQGGLSQVDSFDPKPALAQWDGKLLPADFGDGKLLLAQINAFEARFMQTRRTFKKHGGSGIEISDLFEHTAELADDLAVIRSCYHESFIHGPALSMLNTGSLRLGAPSLGAWTLYGLGSESDSLPAYVVMTDNYLRSSKSLYGTGFLPATYQGTLVSTSGPAFENLDPPSQISAERQRSILNQLNRWNRGHLETREDDSRLNARMSNYELAFRMQMAAPELMELAKEPAHIRELYGLDGEQTGKFGGMCLLARRMVERGVRFVQLYSSGWDGHSECDKSHRQVAAKMDQPVAGLLKDLKQQGLLDSTLVVCAGEFGRTPVMQGKDGRDHNPYGFSAWMAGGGIRGGKVVGATDEFGFAAVEDKVHVNDLHATILELLGLDHMKLTYFFEGLERRATGVGDSGHNSLASRLIEG
jgi:hypothetical protein